MSKFDTDMFLNALRVYAFHMSDDALEPYVRQRIKDFLIEKRTPIEIYDFCDGLSKLPCERFGKNQAGGALYCVGDIDAFGQRLFDVTKHYIRPEEPKARSEGQK